MTDWQYERLGEYPAAVREMLQKDRAGHDVNDAMLAEADRQGLRIRSATRLRSNNLGFLFGDV